VLTGRAEHRCTVTLPGGDLDIDYGDGGRVLMTGPAVEVFSTTIEVET
jgi:diaminopimelate epimerase